MNDETQGPSSNPARCRHRSCRRSGKCHERRLNVACLSVIPRASPPRSPFAPTSPELKARFDAFDAEARDVLKAYKSLGGESLSPRRAGPGFKP